MEHVFIGPEDISIAALYQGFKGGEHTELILMNDFIRKTAKAFTLLEITSLKKSDILLWPHFDHTIGDIIKHKNWDNNICFIIYGRIYESYGMSIIRYLREKFVGCKIVIYLGDIVPSFKFVLDDIKAVFDKVISFDIKEADDYGLAWCLEPFSSDVTDKMLCREMPIQWDITFVGAAKNRYDKIIEMYEILKVAGFTCDFHITGVKPQDRLYKDEIGYDYMDFMSLLEHVNCSNCIAEILQEGGTSPTTRYSEAMLLGKNLLTDCKHFKDKNNRTDNIFYFDDVSELKNWDLGKLREKNPVETAKYRKLLSIEEMIKTIDNSLS